MHCLSCNSVLSDSEAVRQDVHGTYPDMCFDCLPTVIYDFETDDDYWSKQEKVEKEESEENEDDSEDEEE